MSAPGDDPRAALPHAVLASLVREHLLDGHLIDRAGMPLLLGHVDAGVMAEVAIEEWRGASPLYTRRMQQLLGFQGTDVATIFKGMQLDVGAPPQFLDFRYEVHDADHGEFRLAHCGALMDVEPMGEEMVQTMCHDIEDPTFPATACATNARARVEPVHRPPRSPVARHPHCHWTVTIDPDAEPADEPTEADRLATSLAAQLPLADAGAAVGDERGRRHYAGPLEDDVDLRSFAPSVLAAIDDEVCLQGHLLVLSFLAAVTERLGPEVAVEIGRGQLTGVGGVVAGRLRDLLGVGSGLDAVATVLALHPAFRPHPYVGLRIERTDPDDGPLRVALLDGPGAGESLAPSWPALLAGDPEVLGPMDAIVQAVDPTARCRPVEAASRGADEVAAWWVELGGSPADEPGEVTLVRFSTGADFRFEDR